jgi:hypothetical protein
MLAAVAIRVHTRTARPREARLTEAGALGFVRTAVRVDSNRVLLVQP